MSNLDAEERKTSPPAVREEKSTDLLLERGLFEKIIEMMRRNGTDPLTINVYEKLFKALFLIPEGVVKLRGGRFATSRDSWGKLLGCFSIQAESPYRIELTPPFEGKDISVMEGYSLVITIDTGDEEIKGGIYYPHPNDASIRLPLPNPDKKKIDDILSVILEKGPKMLKGEIWPSVLQNEIRKIRYPTREV